jgi:hypothetical protein
MATVHVREQLTRITWRRIGVLTISAAVFGGFALVLWPIVKATYGWQ